MKCFLTFCITVFIFTGAISAQVKKTNFIIFLTDDQGYNDVGVFGSPNIKTPHLDRMAKEGMHFTNFYAQPLCGPSRSALLTGSYPIRVAEPKNLKNIHTQLHPKEVTIAEVLKPEGYKTACIGKWHVGDETNQMPLQQGFDYFLERPNLMDLQNTLNKINLDAR